MASKKQKKQEENKCYVLYRNEIAGKISQSLDLDLNTYLYRNEDNPHFQRYKELQEKATRKKYDSGDKSLASSRKKRTLSTFTDNLQRMARIASNWDAIEHQHAHVLDLAAGFIKHVLGHCDTEEVFTYARHSAGTTIGTTYMLSNLENKWMYPLSCTANSRLVFEEYLLWDRQLARSLADYNRMSVQPMYREVTENKVITVPKDDTKDRVIAIEATLNMFFEQGLMGLMVDRMCVFGIDLSKLPDHHRLTVMVQSVIRSLATIDFSMASDSILLLLCRRLFPSDWQAWFEILRSPRGLLGGQSVDYPIISSMGNATTFPIETLVFWALALAVYQSSTSKSTIPDITLIGESGISVFGDDVILPCTVVKRYMSVCNDFGLLINESKSFFGQEKFRESCGVDSFDARNVRPFYLKAPAVDNPEGHEAWLYTCFNKLKPIAISAYGPLAWPYMNCVQYLLETLHHHTNGKILVVPDDMPDDSGLKLFHEPVVRDIMRAKGLTCSTVGRDIHGTFHFKYLRAIYPSTGDRSGMLHYPVALKKKRLGCSSSSLTVCITVNGRRVEVAQLDPLTAVDKAMARYIKKDALAYVTKKGKTSFTSWD